MLTVMVGPQTFFLSFFFSPVYFRSFVIRYNYEDQIGDDQISLSL